MWTRILIVTFTFLMFPLKLHPQQPLKDNWYIGGSYHYGFMHPFRMSVKYNLKDHVHGLEIKAGKKFTGENIWDQLYRYPEAGLAYYYGSLGNNNVFGKAHALYPYFSAPLYSGDRYRLSYQVGAGISYITKTFDLASNNLNILIGTHINSFVKFAAENEFRLSPQLFITNEFIITHYSNGRVKSPNKGLNQITASIGLKYFPDHKHQYNYQLIPEYQGKNEFSVISGYASKVINQFNSDRYNVYTLSFDYSRLISYKRELTAGIDVSYDGSLKRLISDDTGVSAGQNESLRLGIHAGQEVKFYNVGITLQLGAYLYNKWKGENHFIYQRYGIRYYLTDSFFLATVLKAHLGVADYLTWGIGINL